VRAANRSIVLIGFMGTGKSSVGRRLADATGWPRYDTDSMIATTLGMRITEIFDILGEERFREEEAAILQKLDENRRAIIVTGGGAILRPENVARLRALGTIVCLTANHATLLERLGRRPERPLLRTENPAATLEKLLQEREPLYAAAADLSVDTSALTHDEVADFIRKSLALSDGN
jgi:shikimate kinase